MYKVKITNCSNHIEEITLQNGSYTIGRSMDSVIRLESDEVSRLHARLLVSQIACEIIDEESSNGTFINGNRISSYRLNNGDLIQIGKFELAFHSEKTHHYPADFILEDTTTKGRRIIWSLLGVIVILMGLIIYQRISWKNTWLGSQIQLAETSSYYLAEKNKEALYLGEYTSLNLSNLSSQIVQAVIFDRHGKIQIFKPHSAEPMIRDYQVESMQIRHKNKYTIEITTPILYDSIRVGTLWMLYQCDTGIKTRSNSPAWPAGWN